MNTLNISPEPKEKPPSNSITCLSCDNVNVASLGLFIDNLHLLVN